MEPSEPEYTDQSQQTPRAGATGQRPWPGGDGRPNVPPKYPPYVSPVAHPPYGQGYAYPQSTNSGLAIVLGLLSIFCLQLILGPIAWVVSNMGLRAIDSGRANPSERGTLMVARACSIVGTVIGGVIVVFGISLLVRPRPVGSPNRPGPAEIDVPAGGNVLDAVERVGSGGTVRLAAGTYNIPSVLDLNVPMSLVGAGADKTCIATDYYSVVHVNADNVRLADIAFQHNGVRAGGVITVTGKNFRIDRCRASGAVGNPSANVGGIGLWIHDDASGAVAHCTFRDNEDFGIEVLGTSHVSLTGNYCTRNSVGIDVFGQTTGAVISNICDENRGEGIGVAQESDVTVRDNECSNNTHDGIGFNDRATGVASGNSCTNNGVYGISAGGSATPTMTGNRCEGNGDTGIALFQQYSGDVSQNRCVNNHNNGIYVESTAEPRLNDNILSGNPSGDVDDERGH